MNKIFYFIVLTIGLLGTSQSQAAQCSGQPNAGTISITGTDTLCAGESAYLKLNGYTADSSIALQWQMLTSGSANYINVGGNDTSTTLLSPGLSGNTYFRCYLTCLNSGLSDTAAAFLVYLPGLVSVDNDTICAPGTIDVVAHGIGSTSWFADNLGSPAIHIGDSLNAAVNSDTVFYAQNNYFKRYVGAPLTNTALGTAGNSTTLTRGAYFRTYSSAIFDTVHIYPGNATTYKICLLDSGSTTVIDSVLFTATNTMIGQKTPVPLNWTLNPGHTYFITPNMTGNTASLSRNTTGAAYPYAISNIASITGNNLVPTNTAAYYFFYDWRLHRSCTSDIQAVPVHIGPLVITANASADSICTGDAVMLTASGASTYTWEPGTLAGSSVTLHPLNTDTYTVVAQGAGGCTDSTTVHVIVNTPGTITATASQTTICSGASVTLSATGGSGYAWMPGNLSGSQATANPTATTTYHLTGIDEHGCNLTDSVLVNVAVVNVTAGSGATGSICQGDSALLTANGAVSYLWNPGANPNASFYAKPTSTTTYTVTGTDANGCTGTASVNVPVAVVNITASATPLTVCPGDSVRLSATGSFNLTWSPMGVTGNNIYDHPTSTTVYTVTGTGFGASAACIGTDTITVYTDVLPVADFTVTNTGNTYSFSNNSANSSNYQWDFGDSISSGATNPTYTWSTPGTYTVILTSSNACGSDTATYTITIEPLGLNENTNAVHLVELYPNPAGLSSTLCFTLAQNTLVSVKLSNTLGSIVYAKEISANRGPHQQSIDLSELPNGIYFLQVGAANNIVTKRLIIAR